MSVHYWSRISPSFPGNNWQLTKWKCQSLDLSAVSPPIGQCRFAAAPALLQQLPPMAWGIPISKFLSRYVVVSLIIAQSVVLGWLICDVYVNFVAKRRINISNLVYISQSLSVMVIHDQMITQVHLSFTLSLTCHMSHDYFYYIYIAGRWIWCRWSWRERWGWSPSIGSARGAEGSSTSGLPCWIVYFAQ